MTELELSSSLKLLSVVAPSSVTELDLSSVKEFDLSNGADLSSPTEPSSVKEHSYVMLI